VSLQEYLESLTDSDQRRVHFFKAGLCKISEQKGYRYYVEQNYKEGEEQLRLSRIESFDGELYREYYPASKSGIVDDQPLLTSSYPLPAEYVVCVSGSSLSAFIKSKNPRLLGQKGGLYEIWCEKAEQEHDYQGKKVITTEIFKFYVDKEKGFLPARIEIGERLTHGDEVKYENVPEVLYEVQLRKYDNGVYFPEAITTTYFKWLSDPGAAAGKWERLYKGFKRITRISSFRSDIDCARETYSLEFPPGTSISDRVLKAHYTKGQ
jgi:hypothetical protein